MVIWVLIAESSRARIFLVDKPRGPLRELETLAHPKARMHEQELTADLPGRSFDSAGEARHAMEPNTNPKEREAADFAKRIARRLDSARTENNFDKLVMAAAPKFLGRLRKELSTETLALVTREINKNLVQLDARTLRRHLPERL
ncbi:MAG: host attachment protein [Acidiferrobacterales bacterium]